MFSTIANTKPQIKFESAKTGDIYKSVLDNSLLLNSGLELSTSLKSGLTLTLNGFNTNKED